MIIVYYIMRVHSAYSRIYKLAITIKFLLFQICFYSISIMLIEHKDRWVLLATTQINRIIFAPRFFRDTSYLHFLYIFTILLESGRNLTNLYSTAKLLSLDRIQICIIRKEANPPINLSAVQTIFCIWCPNQTMWQANNSFHFTFCNKATICKLAQCCRIWWEI